MLPEYIVMIFDRSPSRLPIVITAAIAYSMQEASTIAERYQDDCFYVVIIPCDYSIRGE
jgi:hypothetical protein